MPLVDVGPLISFFSFFRYVFRSIFPSPYINLFHFIISQVSDVSDSSYYFSLGSDTRN